MDVSVGFLIENLKQLVLYNVHLVAVARTELDGLLGELTQFNAILKDASIKYKKDEIFKAWERDIREVVYDIEDTIDTCVTHMAARNHFKRLFESTPITLAETVKKIRREKVQPLLNTKPETLNFTVDDAKDTTVADARKIRQKKTKNIVGFEEEAKEFIDFLNEESDKLEVASVVGMAGLGKTTLAWKIFEDPKIQFEFPVRIWVNVSDSPNMENVLLTILKHFTKDVTPSPKSTEAETQPPKEVLLKLVTGYLKGGKSLIVFDDIWITNTWKEIKDVLPMKENPKCKVLGCIGPLIVTTRNKNVAEAAATRDPHYLRFLYLQESWELLQYLTYENLTDIPKELEGVGNVIAKYCDGLPLSIVVIGGILLEKKLAAGGNILAIREAWSDISKRVKPYLVEGDKKQLLSSIISLSYEKIPYELRNCFLYLGVFPEDANIPVKELIRLWIAEGFIQEKEGMSMEQVALENLNDFINRNLVMVKKAKLDGEPKICQIHDSVREICRREAKYDNLNLFQEITRSEKGFFEPRENVEKFRRLCIHSYVVDFFKLNRKVPIARSFLCFHPSPIILQLVNMAAVTNGFTLLRVYNAKNIKFPKFPVKVALLLHLRYLTLVMEQCTFLPKIISKLLHLQTLIVDISSKTLEVHADILRMRQLRHLKTKATITLKSDGKGEGGENLQTLSRLSPESCTKEVFEKARNLITLGIQGELNKYTFSDGLFSLEGLQKLKLVNQVPNGVTAENPLLRLPESQNFPPNLKILVVSGTHMQWSKMSILSQIGSLEMLKLKENAFKGNTWDAIHVFPNLEILHLEKLTGLAFWKADICPFPKLKFLLLNNCENLTEVPDGVCENLETLRMERVTKDAVNSAEAIAKRKQENGVLFKLEIAPAQKIQNP